MKISRLLLSIILCLYLSGSCYAKSTVVVLQFDDNTPYKEWQTAEVMSEILLADLIDFPNVELMERKAIKETIAAEQSFNSSSAVDISSAIQEGNFDAFYDGVAGQASLQKVGDKLNADKTSYLGREHHADYLLHGSIDYLGTGESSFMSPFPQYDFSYKAPSLDAVVTIRLIKAETGAIIWLTQKRGVSKESLWKYHGLAIGSDELNNQLFVEALEKISKKVMKQMTEDMQKGSLKLN